METECKGTQNALEAALSVNIEKVIYTSTALTVGERKGEVGTETTKHRGYLLSKYEQAKFEAEKVAISYLDKGLPIIIVNPASIYGPGDFKPSGRATINFLNGCMPGSFKGFNSLVFIGDVGKGHFFAAEKGKIGERYILSGNVVTLNEWGRLLCQLSGVKMPPTIPAFLAGIYASFGEIISCFTNRPPVISSETFRLVSHDFQVDGSKAVKELGVKYTPFEKGLQKTVLWYWEKDLLKHKPACVTEVE